jgi:hypothetical protein
MRTFCWICLLWALTAALLFSSFHPTPAAAQPPLQVASAAQVVTAPWAVPGKHRPAEESRFVPPPLPATPPPPPLSEEQRRTLKAVQSERLPEPTWLRYVVSNEWRHDVTFPRIAGLGGAYVGVATDQNYTVAAAARAELLFLMDYDAEVGRVHRVYHAFIEKAPGPAEFRALFEPGSVERGKEILAAAAESPKDAARLQRTYVHYRDRLQIYLRHVAQLRVGERHPTWLGDPAAYTYLRALVLGGRVAVVQGDLNGTVALRSIGEAARAVGVPVRIIYTSNAEGFFPYSAQFRANLAALPHDDRTVVLRTFHRRFPAPIGDTWHYNLHQLDDFLSRLARPGYPSIKRVVQDLYSKAGQKAVDPVGVSYYDASIPMH